MINPRFVACHVQQIQVEDCEKSCISSYRQLCDVFAAKLDIEASAIAYLNPYDAENSVVDANTRITEANGNDWVYWCKEDNENRNKHTWFRVVCYSDYTYYIENPTNFDNGNVTANHADNPTDSDNHIDSGYEDEGN